MYGRKLSSKYENPIDNILLYITEKLNPVYKYLNFTPNTLTTFSLVFALGGLYIYTKNYIILGPILYFIGYYFDCADGNYARKYNIQSKFGDYYDHIGDLIKVIVFFYIYFSSNIKINTKIYIVIFIILLNILTGLYMVYQEYIYNKPHESTILNLIPNIIAFDILKINKKNIKKNMKYIRYFGPGTVNLIYTLILIFLKDIDKFIISQL